MNSNDPFKINKITFEEILNDLQKVKQTIKSINLNFDKSRFGTYHQRIVKLWDAINVNQTEKFRRSNDFETSIIALVESIELISIFDNLPITTNPVLTEKIRKILKGPILPRDENHNSNESRNTIFELNLGAHFKKATNNVDFSTGDFLSIYNGDTFVFECKRPFAQRNTMKNFNKANRQLSSKINAQPNYYGIIALSINRLLTKGELFPVVNTEEQLKMIMENAVQDFISLWEQKFISKIINIKILGMIVHLLVPAIVEDQGIPFISQFSGITNFCLNNSSDFFKLKNLSMSLRPI